MKTQNWHAGHIGIGEFRREAVFDADGHQIAEMLDRGQKGEEVARLMAAAPVLLAALTAIIKTLDFNNVPVPSYLRRDENQARAAIAKATE